MPGKSVGITDTGDGGTNTAATMAPTKSMCRFYHFTTDDCNLRKVNTYASTIDHVADNGCGTVSGDGIAATSAILSKNAQVGINTNNGDIFLYETSHIVRKIDGTTGIITVIAGQMGVDADVAPIGQDATSATLGGMNDMSGITVHQCKF